MTPSIPQVHSPNAADDFPWVWVSLREIQALWEGAPQLSTRRAPGGDPTGGHAWPFPVGRMEGPVDLGVGPHNPREVPSFPWEIRRLVQGGAQWKSVG